MIKQVKMLPVDPEQCQAMKPNGNTFATFGGKPGLVRCKNKPAWIATEKVAQENERGSMSLCHDCKKVCEKQMPDKVTFQILGRDES